MKSIAQGILNKAKTERYILSRSMLVIFASLFGNVFGYLFQIMSGRYLSVEDYSILVSLFSLSGILLMPITFFIGGTTKFVAEVKDSNYPYRISGIFVSLLRFSVLFAGSMGFVMIVFSKQIAEYLNINNVFVIVAFSAAVFAGNLMGFVPIFLQGLMRFKAYSAITFLTALTKFLTIVTVILFALNVIDVFWGLAVTTLAVGAMGLYFLKKNITFKNLHENHSDFLTIIKYSLLSALGVASITMMQNIDVVIVKHHFSEALAGIYGSTTVIGRIVFFASSPVGIVMLPICSEKFRRREDFVKPFIFSLLISVGIALSVFIVYALIPNFTIKILFGSKYLGAVEYLAQYGFYMVLYTILNMLTVFFISTSNFKFASAAVIAPVLAFIGLQYFNQTLNQIISINIFSTLSAIFVLSILFLKVYKSKGLIEKNL